MDHRTKINNLEGKFEETAERQEGRAKNGWKSDYFKNNSGQICTKN